MHERYGDDVTFVGVAGRDDLGAIKTFIEDRGVGGFDHVVDADGSIWAAYSITTQPSFVFLDEQGTAETNIGALGVDGLTRRVEALALS